MTQTTNSTVHKQGVTKLLILLDKYSLMVTFEYCKD